MKSKSLKVANAQKRIILLLACLTMTIGCPIVADTLDSTQIQLVLDSVASHQGTNAVEVSGEWWSFIKSVMASVVAAIIALVLFFSLLRPKIHVEPTVAIEGTCKEDGNKRLMCRIIIKNKSLFACNGLQIKVCHLETDGNDNKSIKEIESETFLSIGGRFKNENESVHSIPFLLDPERVPRQILISVIAQHSLSSIMKGKFIYINNTHFKFGYYEKDTFVPIGNSYLQVLMRENKHKIKVALGVLCLFFVILLSILLTILRVTSVCTLWEFSITYLLFWIIAIGIWQLLVFSKAHAYNRNRENLQLNNLHLVVVNRESKDAHHLSKDATQVIEAEDVKPEEEIPTEK